MTQEFEDEGAGYLVWDVGNADVEEGEACFDGVSLDDLEFAFFGRPFDAFEDLADHAVVVFYGDDVFGLLEEGDGHVSGSGTDFEDGVGGFEGGFGDDGGDDGGVFEKVLAEGGVGGDEVGAGGGFGGMVGGGGGGGGGAGGGRVGGGGGGRRGAFDSFGFWHDRFIFILF
mmetsp:Transcript_30992/g.64823  ORF Transcript_30992/g.64823 Transcript_30992/m.64823 type:complete len:171 (+) Transcript_30992:522-1034(+)